MSEDKIYCGSAKVITTQYGPLTKVTLHKDNVNAIVKYMKDNASDFCTFNVLEKREKTDGKPTHYCVIDQWKPDAQSQTPSPNTYTGNPSPNDQQHPTQQEIDDDLPF